jgi:hypothetical protein
MEERLRTAKHSEGKTMKKTFAAVLVCAGFVTAQMQSQTFGIAGGLTQSTLFSYETQVHAKPIPKGDQMVDKTTYLTKNTILGGWVGASLVLDLGISIGIEAGTGFGWTTIRDPMRESAVDGLVISPYFLAKIPLAFKAYSKTSPVFAPLVGVKADIPLLVWDQWKSNATEYLKGKDYWQFCYLAGIELDVPINKGLWFTTMINWRYNMQSQAQKDYIETKTPQLVLEEIKMFDHGIDFRAGVRYNFGRR